MELFEILEKVKNGEISPEEGERLINEAAQKDDTDLNKKIKDGYYDSKDASGHGQDRDRHDRHDGRDRHSEHDRHGRHGEHD